MLMGLAGIIKAPNRYSPFNNKETTKERRDFVLNRLYDENFITEAQYKESVA